VGANFENILTIVTVVKDDLVGLQRTSRSLLSQSDKFFEWLIVDAFSTDGTSEFASSLDKEGYCRVITQRPEGIYEAMNFALSNLQTNWVWFINCGDFLLDSGGISRAKNLIANTNSAAIATRVLCFGSGAEIYDVLIPVLQFTDNRVFLHANHQGVLFQTKAISKFGKFDTRYRFAADSELMDKFASTGDIEIADESLAGFVLGGRSALNIKRTLQEINCHRDAKSHTGSFLWIIFKTRIRLFLLNRFFENHWMNLARTNYLESRVSRLPLKNDELERLINSTFIQGIF